MGVINLRKEYIEKIMNNQTDRIMDEDSYLEFLETMSLNELRALAEDCE